MTTSIFSGPTTVTPTLVLGWESSHSSNNVIHNIIGRVMPDVTLRPATPRAGTLTLFFLNYADAQAAVALHTNGTVLHLTDTDFPGLNMAYVLSGDCNLTLDPGTQTWQVTAVYSEVAP